MFESDVTTRQRRRSAPFKACAREEQERGTTDPDRCYPTLFNASAIIAAMAGRVMTPRRLVDCPGSSVQRRSQISSWSEKTWTRV
jgi:hypothetical protein